MRNKFEIDDDGSIFSIGEDGTIRRFGNINSHGDVKDKKSNTSTGLLWFLLVVIIIIAIVLGINLSSAKRDLSSSSYIQNNLNEKLNELEVNLNGKIIELETNLSDVSSTFPFKINRIELGNIGENSATIDDYGSSLYDYRMRYLSPKIYYTGFASGKTITINYKIFKPNGALDYNSSYSTTYTGSETSATIYKGNGELVLKGWGNSTSSTYSSGNYRIEVWSTGICFSTKNFTIW
jgi:hypothetical protein